MSSTSPFPEQTHPIDSAVHDRLTVMKRADRTPSLAPEAHLSSADQTPNTPLFNRSSFLDDGPAPQSFSDSCQLNTSEHLVEFPLLVRPRPQTPTLKRMKLDWHGLPSPSTPSCNVGVNTKFRGNETFAALRDGGEQGVEDFWSDELTYRNTRLDLSPTTPRCKSSSVSSGASGFRDQIQFTPATLIEGDTDLALQLWSPSSIRRSTRLRGRVLTQEEPKVKVKASRPLIKSPSPAAQEESSVILTQAEAVQSPFEVAVASSIELPGLHSTQWQLMYPPGGSTHPSYPWPSADPRLTFHAHYVPLKNGLPDVSSVPTLRLPPGWHHTSWSGLYPVVFDPFKQAFKITPVGPLPLTCEELHQGGLENYVPGGRLHREYGMLPMISSLSDGSDAEVYNFDGVDWVLPWAHIGGVPDIEQSATGPVCDMNNALADCALPVIEMPRRYIEARDCPDLVFDLQDGWRWLLEMEGVPSGTFAPTPGRKWRGTGVARTSRKTKQPIAALMAITMAENEEDNAERYLGNQDRRNFCPFKSVATPVHVNITLLEDTEFTLVELLSYFPFHYQWRHAGERMIRAGLSAWEISNFINMSRCLPGASICSQGSVDHHVFRKFKDEETNEATQLLTKTTGYTAEGWTYDVWEMTDYPLLALTHGLTELPSGVDAGPLTALIMWVRGQGRFQTMLSEVPALLKEANIEALIDPGEGVDPEKEVLSRHAKALRKDRSRVLKEIKVLREKEEAEAEVGASEAAKEKSSKRRRLE